MNKKVLISLFIFLCLFINIFLNNSIVNAVVVTNTTGFEDGTISYNYSNSWLTTGRHSTNLFYVNNNAPYTGIKNFYIKPINSVVDDRYVGIWNYTYSSSQFMHQWESYIKGTNNQVSYLTLSFRDATDKELIRYRIKQYSGGIPYVFEYQDFVGAWHTINSSVYDVWHRIGFSYQSNDTVYYWDNNVVVSGTPRNITDNPRITHVRMYTTQSILGMILIYNLDDNTIWIADTISGAGITPSVFPECPGNEIGQLTSNNVQVPIIQHTPTFITTVYAVISTFNITRFDILVNGGTPVSQYQSIELKINQHNLGLPNYFSDRGSVILVSWNNLSQVGISGQMIWITLKYLDNGYHTMQSRPFLVAPLVSDDDIDNDGFIGCTVHEDDLYWDNFNSQYMGYSIGLAHGFSPIIVDYDLVYRFCYENRQEGNIEDYVNDLAIIPLTVNIGENVNIGYTISKIGLGYENYLNINKSGVDYLNILLMSQAGSYLYRALELGDYNVSLIQNSVVVKTVTFSCVGVLPDVYIYTSVAQTTIGEDFIISYKYPYTSYDGTIRYLLNELLTTITVIQKNTSGNMTYSFNAEGYYTLFLYINVSGDYAQVASCKMVINGGHGNYISLSDSNIIIPKTITIFGSHNFIGANIFIYRNGESLKYVGDTSNFQAYDYITTSGFYNYTLVAKYGNKNIILDYATLSASVTETGMEKPEDDFISDFIADLPIAVQVILGLLLTLFITLLPLIIGIVLSSHQIDMPNMVYVAFFFLGLGVSCGIGLLNWALFFVILLGLIIYFVVQQQQNKG